jgi:hypothetical protein
VTFQNRALVLTQWAWHYVTRSRSARLILGDEPHAPRETGGGIEPSMGNDRESG